jgi:hypothetical protein
MKSHLPLLFIFLLTLPSILPATANLSHNVNNTNNTLARVIYSELWKIDTDGRLVFNITNLGNEGEDIENLTEYVHFYGSSSYTALNRMDVNTTVFIQHLSHLEWKHLKTKDPVFKVRRIINQPLIFFGNYLMNESIGAGDQLSYQLSRVLTLIHFIRQDTYYHYP